MLIAKCIHLYIFIQLNVEWQGNLENVIIREKSKLKNMYISKSTMNGHIHL